MFKNKLKIISVLSAAMIWFYVIAIVNPDTTTSIEGLPVNISNTVELAENNLILTSDSKPTVDLQLEGKVSDLRKIKKESIRASIEIQNPSEGKNEAMINVSLPSNIRCSLKEDTVIVRLEKTISKDFNISVEVPDNINIFDYAVNKSIDTVKVSGPRSVLNKVDKIVAVIKEDSFKLNKDIGVQLKAVDLKGNLVENATLENSIIQVRLNKLEEKEVSVEPIFDSYIDKNKISMNPEKIIIYGEPSTLENINKVYTKPINIKELKNKNEISVEIELPTGVSTIKNIPDNTVEFKNEILISLKKD